MPEEGYSAKDVGRAILEMLGVQKGETLEILRNKRDPLEIKVRRHPAGQEQKPT
jgi:hypothetical protein